MEAAARLICGIIEFTARMQCGKNKTFRTDSLFMHPHRNSPPVVIYGSRTVSLQGDPDSVAVAGQMLVHRVVHDFIYQMIQTLGRYASDIHTGSLSYCFQSFKDRYAGSIIIIAFCHV